jgi:hypothetical protein
MSTVVSIAVLSEQTAGQVEMAVRAAGMMSGSTGWRSPRRIQEKFW